MSATNKSLYYNLPVFAENDKPAWMEDFNSAMQTIDKTMKQNDDKATQAKTTAEGVSQKIVDYDSVKSTATQAKATADTSLSKANSAQQTANSAVSSAQTAQQTGETAQRSAQTAQTTAESANTLAGQAMSKANKNEGDISSLKSSMITGSPIFNYDIVDNSYNNNKIYITFDKTSRMLYINGEVKVKYVPDGSAKLFTIPSNIIEAIGYNNTRVLIVAAFMTTATTINVVNGQLFANGDYTVTGRSEATYYSISNAIYTGEWE